MLKLTFHNEWVLLNSVFPYGNFRAGILQRIFVFPGMREELVSELGREPINSEWSADVRFGAHSGLKSDIA